MEIKRRFYENVETSPESECWKWVGGKDARGYGIFRAYGFAHRAHRFSWLLHYGEFPNEMLVCHKCDNPSCVNPEHLFLGTQFDNMRDMVNKGRNANVKGNKNPRANLSDQDVMEIRRLWDDDRVSPKELSKMFGTPKSTINKIISSDTWKHLPPCKRQPSNRDSRLTEPDVLEMRRLYGHGLSSTILGKMFKLTQQQAWKVVNYWSWKNVA